MGVARLGVVGAGAAELLHRDVLAGDGLDDVGAGDEHVGGAVDHDREVGDRGGVDVPAGAGAHDQRDLRDDAGGVHVAAEDLAVEAEGDHALLDAGAGALVDADDRAAGLDREVHDLGDLLAVDLAQRAAEDGEVLGEHAHLAAVDGAVAGDHAVAVGAVLLQPERRRAVPGQLVELDEGALVEEHLDPLAGGLAALGVLLLDRLGRAGVHRLVEPPVEVGQLARGGVDVDVLGDVGALARLCAHLWWPPVDVIGPWANLVPVTSDPSPRAHPSTAPRLARSPGPAGSWRVEVVDAAASTNAWRAERARDGRGRGLVVVAEHQTAGRGRLDRTWETPPGSALTLLGAAAPRPTPAAVALAAAADRARRGTALREAGLDARLKWPNDVLLGDAQGRRHPRRADRDARSVPAAVVGIGLNVSHDRRRAAGAARPPRWRSARPPTSDRTDLLPGCSPRCARPTTPGRPAGDQQDARSRAAT